MTKDTIPKLKLLYRFIKKLPRKACSMMVIMDRALDGHHGDYISDSKMKKQGFECGSVGCLKGWTEVMANLMRTRPYKYGDYNFYARHWLGLDTEESDRLFFRYPYCLPVGVSYKRWMLKRLEIVIKTGRVDDWTDVPVLKRLAGE